MTVGLHTRPLDHRDLDTVLSIQSASPEMAQWTLWDYNRVASGEMVGWVAEQKSVVIGFLVARHTVDDVEILNFAVAPDSRRQGVGAALFATAIGWAKSLPAENIFLEVRESNHAAISFYEHHNFVAKGLRPHYYSAPPEDALVFTLRLT